MTPAQLSFLYEALQKRTARERAAFVADTCAAVSGLLSKEGQRMQREYLDALSAAAGESRRSDNAQHIDIDDLA